MKKLFFLLSVCLIVAACSSDDSPEMEEPLTPVNAFPVVCDYPLGKASDATAGFRIATQTNPTTGKTEKMMYFNASLSRETDAHHGETFRVFFYKDANLKEMVLTDSFITRSLSLKIDVTDYKEQKLYVLFKAVGCSTDMLYLHHGYKGVADFKPAATTDSSSFRFDIVNGESLGACIYPIGSATAGYTVKERDYPAGKVLTIRAAISGTDPHHSSGEWQVLLYADENLQNLIDRGYSNGRDTFDVELNVTGYSGYAVYVVLKPPHACSTNSNNNHYFLGKAQFNASLSTDSQTFKIVTVNK